MGYDSTTVMDVTELTAREESEKTARNEYPNSFKY